MYLNYGVEKRSLRDVKTAFSTRHGSKSRRNEMTLSTRFRVRLRIISALHQTTRHRFTSDLGVNSLVRSGSSWCRRGWAEAEQLTEKRVSCTSTFIKTTKTVSGLHNFAAAERLSKGNCAVANCVISCKDEAVCVCKGRRNKQRIIVWLSVMLSIQQWSLSSGCWASLYVLSKCFNVYNPVFRLC